MNNSKKEILKIYEKIHQLPNVYVYVCQIIERWNGGSNLEIDSVNVKATSVLLLWV